ncbi:Spo0B C-terminal domain-containing protein [Priestia koreensis]|uniref:Sporulation initiation phosphotransferase B C-terminal domain-containing protein n=1 Tax=Priestia koreensis TaxID=284581 RepID=A0A0M0L7J8_9BACI|nr:Spo0B C-terminal domain-containing protein [Priestia koreensis]KOO46979.1 hypothetical protein AMD01_08695 [Priestia koreensis]MCM3002635.1 sporulation initiation phosphotransferase B [Priestia koreensis]UNL84340.1 Spo0B domain-containing protein [Priestia koreensis]
MDKDWNVVEVLRYARHDWLNRLQLIKGNLALNRLDRVDEIINEIITQAKHESNLTNTRLHMLTEFIMTYQWCSHPIELEIEVLGEIKDLSMYDEAITAWCKQFISLLESAVDIRTQNHLSMSLLVEKDQTRFFFDFSGILEQEDLIHLWLNQKNNSSFHIKEQTTSKEEISVVVELKGLGDRTE